MNSDEIRKRAAGIAFGHNVSNDALKTEIIKLAEDILGKPLEPEFDESLVKHGSVWKWISGDNYLLIETIVRTGDEPSFSLISLKDGRLCSSDIHLLKDRNDTISRCKRFGQYLGQFDFSYPQKSQLLNEAVELLRKWQEWWDEGNSIPSDQTKAFLAKLGGKQ